MAGLRGRALVAYLLVCIVWGSTYLAIRIGVQELPPLLFAGVRFLIAGALLAGLVRLTGGRLPARRRDWGVLAVVGLFLLLGGNAVVVWAEQFVESGPASVFVAAVPLWAAFFDAMIPGGSTVFTWRVGLGLALGFFGSALLAGISPNDLLGADLKGPIALTLASASWALGSVYSKRRPTESSPYAASAVQMLVGGAAITLLGLLGGEAADWHTTSRGLGALAYLVVFGSIVGFTAYAYALRHASATVVGTYAYVNPVVAVLLGWLVLGEAVTSRTIAAMVLILGAVLMIQLAPKRGPRDGDGAGAGSAVRQRRRAGGAGLGLRGRHPAQAALDPPGAPRGRTGLLRPHACAGRVGTAPRADPPLQRGERRGEHEHRRVS
jgi:drug/metabolite transporter (DMT)-like permease